MPEKQVVPTLTLTGLTGAEYKLFVYSLKTQFERQPGFYLVLREEVGKDTLIYIGETDDLEPPISGHPKWPEMMKFLPNRIAVRVEKDAALRKQAVEDLVHTFKPPCNG